MKPNLKVVERVQASPARSMTLAARISTALRRRFLLARIGRLSADVDYYQNSREEAAHRIELALRRQTQLRAELFYLDHPQPVISRVR